MEKSQNVRTKSAFTQKKNCTNFANVYNIYQFLCVYNINLHCKCNVYIYIYILYKKSKWEKLQ